MSKDGLKAVTISEKAGQEGHNDDGVVSSCISRATWRVSHDSTSPFGSGRQTA